MGRAPVIAASARKHGISDDDMLRAYAHPVRVFELDEGFTMVIGASQAATFLEVGVVEGEQVPVIVHAMRAREVPEVMAVPRSVEEILAHADELAARFESYEPSPDDERDPVAFLALRDAVVSRSDAERSVQDAVADARAAGYSWAFVGRILGTSGEAARQRYGRTQDA